MDEDLPPIRYRRAWTLATAAFLLQTVEEAAFDLPQWTLAHQDISWLAWVRQPGAFLLAAGALALVVGALALYATATGPAWSRLALSILAVVMLVNAASHLALSIATQSIMPGVATGLLLTTPITLGVIWASGRTAC